MLPTFMPVATQAAIKGLAPQQVEALGVNLILNNTYHLNLRPGIEVLKEAGGAHRFQGWNHNLLTVCLLLKVMYVGSSQARAIIREYEFYFPKSQKKLKKKKSGLIVSESKQDRIKFDVLLTSYEMINFDSASLKPIMWECNVIFHLLLY